MLKLTVIFVRGIDWPFKVVDNSTLMYIEPNGVNGRKLPSSGIQFVI